MESKKLVDTLHLATKQEAARLIDFGYNPHLAVVLLGENEASLQYIDIKSKRGKEDGVTVSIYHLEADVPKEEVMATLDFLAQDDDVHGIIVQLPLPENWSEQDLAALIARIPHQKDVDGMRGGWKNQSYNGYGYAHLNKPFTHYLPPMVAAVCLLLESYTYQLEDAEIVIVGKGKLVGEPLLQFFQNMKLNVTSVDEETENILAITAKADILITGTGVPNLITHEWIKPGAIVLDCAFDVHRDSVDQIAKAVAPAKGGLGPVTVAWLLRNVVAATAQVHREQGGN